ncbi:chaperonin 10-like protein [Suillus plorans]|uniref:Chaperonin 10-like protein n=1 Tax=Suillus plorans TaxID=116603 RepID=A0A9P7DID4_9AGAM|nr:chaperonin 10-like protein [Suillus plorans]KAG1793981.1 chaperonin 10-like protein [Suillus plorans]
MSSQTHLAFASTAVGITSVIQVPTPSPGPGEVMVKVAFSAVIPLDTYVADYGRIVNGEYPLVLGFNLSGVVEAVGSGVGGLQTGDKVCGFTTAGSKGKGLQERAIIHSSACAKLPDDYSLEAAATIPDNFVTAFYTLFDRLGLTPPTFPVSVPPPHAETPILVYGAGATSGQYAVQLLALAGYKRVIATASPRHHSYLKSLGVAHVIDYSADDMLENILLAAGTKLQFVLDCISAESTLKSISNVVSSDGVVAMLLPVTEGTRHVAGKDAQMWMELPVDRNPFPDSVKVLGVKTLLYQQNEYLRDNLMPKILPRLLEEGIIQPNRVRLFDQGSLQDRCQDAFNVVRNGQVNGEKVIVKVASE